MSVNAAGGGEADGTSIPLFTKFQEKELLAKFGDTSLPDTLSSESTTPVRETADCYIYFGDNFKFQPSCVVHMHHLNNVSVRS